MKRIFACLLVIGLLLTYMPAVAFADDVTLSDKLLAEYNFDDETIRDRMGAFDATLYNDQSVANAGYADGIRGKALKLSQKGTDEKFWLSIPYQVFGENKDSFTLSIWYNSSDYNTSGEDSELFSLYNSTAEKFLFYSPASTAFQDKGFTMKWDGSYGYTNVITPYVQNQWVHLMYAVEDVGAQSRITVYINGKTVTVDQGGDWSNSLMSQLGIDTFTIGGKNPYKGGATPNCLFYGMVDEIRLYSGALTEQEAGELYGQAFTPVEDNVTLLAEYNFDDCTTQDSVGENHGVFYNNAAKADASYTQGVLGMGLQLSAQGTNEKYWLSVPYDAFGENRDSFTISMWYKSSGHNTSGENSELFSLYNSGAEKFLFYGAMTDGSSNAFTMKWDGSYGYANVIGGYQENVWAHLVFSVEVINGQSKITSYINGRKVYVDQGGEWANSLMSQLGIDTFTIGGKNPYKGGETPQCLFYGAVDEIRLYAGALTEEQAAKIYDDVINPVYDRGTVLAEYNFDDMSTQDATGRHHAVFYDNAAASQAKYAEGIVGKALCLSAKNTEEKYWLDIPHRAFGGHKDSFTLSMWYYAADRNTTGENSELFSFYNSGGAQHLFYGIPTDESENGFITKQDDSYGYANVIGGYQPKEWTHLVLAVDGASGQSKITAYINGTATEVDQGGEWANSLMSQLGMDTFTVGGKNPYRGGFIPQCLFYGMVDEIKLYAGALTAQEAAEIYKEHRMPEQRGTLLAEYNFNEENTCDSVLDRNAVFYDNEKVQDGIFTEGINGKALRLSEQGSQEQYWLDIPYSVFGGNNVDTFTVSIWYRSDGCNTEGVSTELFTLYNSEKKKYMYYTPSAVDIPEEGSVDNLSEMSGYANINHTYQAGEWTHLVFTVGTKGTQSRINAYVNGKSLAVNRGGDWTNTLMSLMGMDRFTIGGRNPYRLNYEDGYCPTFYGCVDEIQIYAGELTQQEALNLHEQQVDLWIEAEPVTDYAYAFAVIPDTKTVNFHDPDNLHKIYDWVIQNTQDQNVRFVFELGDITNQNTDEEWLLAYEQIRRLNGVIPHSVVRGDCDDESRFDENFPYSDYAEGLSGSYDQTMRNTYQKLTVGEISYLIVNLDVGASDDVLMWANEIVAAHSGYRVIVTTHAYLDANGIPLTEKSKYAPTASGFANDGEDIWEKFISKHINIDLVICSHSQCDDIVVTTAVGEFGNTVTQMLINPESLDNGYGACGMAAMLYFSEDGRNIEVRYYSTIREKYFKAKNQFTIELPTVIQEPMGEVTQLQITLQEDISMKLYTLLTDAYLQDAGNYAQITVGEESVTVPVSEAEVKVIDGITYHVFTAKVAAAQMTEKITLQFFRSSGEKSEAYICTVREYAQKLLDSAEESACHSLVNQLLDYGAKAQLYFGVNTENLANAGNEIENLREVPEQTEPMKVEGRVDGIDFYGATLLFQNMIAVRYYFTAPDGAEHISFTINGEKCTVEQNNGMYYVECSDINPQQYSEMITVTASDENETLYVSYSPMNYIVRMYNGSASQSLKTLLKALYNYHLEAVAYLN